MVVARYRSRRIPDGVRLSKASNCLAYEEHRRRESVIYIRRQNIEDGYSLVSAADGKHVWSTSVVDT